VERSQVSAQGLPEPVTDTRRGHLAAGLQRTHAGRMDEEQGIYRGEVLAMMFALADIQTDTNEILAILGGEEDGDEEEEVDA
jgi:hypothetical protein